jgi:pimeloyl-ACP methyl ester carboxylesterase
MVGALALSPPLPGAGRRVLDPEVLPELWYQYFHRTALSSQLIDGRPEAVRTYLRHFWTHWSGPNFAVGKADFEELVACYARPGAFTSSIQWYRAGAGYVANALAQQPPAPADRISVSTQVLWQEHDPLFPRSWADRLSEFFSDVTLHEADGVGHFTPLEAPQAFAKTITEAVESTYNRQLDAG